MELRKVCLEGGNMKATISRSMLASLAMFTFWLCGCGGGGDSSGSGDSSLMAVAERVVAGTPSPTSVGYVAGRLPHLLYPSSSTFHEFQTMSGDSPWAYGEETGVVDPTTALPAAWVASTAADMQYAVGVTQRHESTGHMVSYSGVGEVEVLRTVVDITFYDARTAAVVGTVRVIGEAAPYTLVYSPGSTPTTTWGDLDYDDVINAMRPFVEE